MPVVVIQPGGLVRHVYSDQLQGLRALGQAEVRRASRVEPLGCGWTADMAPMGGPVLGPFKTRGLALAAEVSWLEANI